MQEPTSSEHDGVWKVYSLGLYDISRSYQAISISGIWESICHIVEQMMDIRIERVILDVSLWSDGALCIIAPSLMPQHPHNVQRQEPLWMLSVLTELPEDFLYFDHLILKIHLACGALWITFCYYCKVKNPIAALGLKYVSLQVKEFKYNELRFKTDRLGQHPQGSRQCTDLTWWRHGWSKV